MKIIDKYHDAIHDTISDYMFFAKAAVVITVVIVIVGWAMGMLIFGINRTYEINKVEYGRYLKKQEESRVIADYCCEVYELATLEK